jgi:hypothetical protein
MVSESSDAKSPEWNTPVGTPVAELEGLQLASKANTPAPSSTMCDEPTPRSPTQTPPPQTSSPSSSSTGLKFSFSKGAKPASKPAPSKLSNGITAFHAHDDSGSEDEQTSKVTHFENGTIVGEKTTIKEEKKPLVIKPPETVNEHWLQRRLKMFRPDLIDHKPPEGVDLSSIPDRIDNTTDKVGLQITKKPSPPPTSTSDETRPTEDMMVDAPPKSDEELARELLLAQAADPYASTAPKLVIPSREPMTESEVYAADIARLSDAPTLETYERVPVDAFGMGILLGLGWKEGTDLQGKKVEAFKEPKKRPDFLGIGAKEEEILRLNAKGDKLSRKDALGGSWNPLKKIDKRTGEVVVEDARESRRSTPKDRDRSGVNTPRNDGSRYSTPSAGYNSGREREPDRDRRRDDDRERERGRRKDEDRDGRKSRYRDEGRNRDDRRYDSDRESKRRDRDHKSDRKRYDRDYDSDRERKRPRDGHQSTNGSRRESRRASPVHSRSRSPRKER